MNLAFAAVSFILRKASLAFAGVSLAFAGVRFNLRKVSFVVKRRNATASRVSLSLAGLAFLRRGWNVTHRAMSEGGRAPRVSSAQRSFAVRRRTSSIVQSKGTLPRSSAARERVNAAPERSSDAQPRASVAFSRRSCGPGGFSLAGLKSRIARDWLSRTRCTPRAAAGGRFLPPRRTARALASLRPPGARGASRTHA